MARFSGNLCAKVAFVDQTEGEIMDDHRGMLGTLFDFSFTHFVTAKLVKLLFAIGIVGAMIGGIRFIMGGFGMGAGWGVLAILVSPVVFVILVLLVRVAMEIIIVLFRIAECVQTLTDFETMDHAAARRAAPDAPTKSPDVASPVESPDGASTVIDLDSED
jgi:hypothetical protein